MVASRKEITSQDPFVVAQPPKYTDKNILSVRCAQCNIVVTVTLATYWKHKKLGYFVCLECRKPILKAKAQSNPIYKDPSYRLQFKKLHDNPEYFAAVHNTTVNSKISKSTKLAWRDEIKRENHLKHRQTDEYKLRISKWAISKWQDPIYRENQTRLRNESEYKIAASLRTKNLWKDPAYRKAITTVLDKARANSAPKVSVSCLQSILYNILDDMKVVYHKEGPNTIVGPIITSNNRFEGYSFDCLVEHNNRKIYIECNGEYWHNGRENRDNAKATFLTRYFPDSELLVIWEHEYRSQGRIRSIIEERLGIKAEMRNFCFDSVKIVDDCQIDDLRSLFARYHYLANIGRVGSKRYGVLVDDQLVAGVIFSCPTRQESAKRLHLCNNELLELSRFCIAPNFQKKNFASWILSRATNRVWRECEKVKSIITFADTTQGHTGTIYRASNWIFDGIVRPDYWYIGNKGEWYHKKSVWDLASKNSMSESDYAIKHNLCRVMGKEKLRFVLHRP